MPDNEYLTIEGLKAFKQEEDALIAEKQDIIGQITAADVAMMWLNPDPILANNSWAIIRAVCEAGAASSYWHVGDEKTDVGIDGITRTFRIVDMSGLYNKHVVFEQVELESTSAIWNSSSRTDGSGAHNNWSICDMRDVTLPATLLNYSSGLQAAITNTTVKTSKNGYDSTLLETTNKLFLPAEKEIWISKHSSSTTEADALVTYDYYKTHTSNYDHKKADANNTYQYWWLRSPSEGNISSVCMTAKTGAASYNGYNDSYWFAPCFSF